MAISFLSIAHLKSSEVEQISAVFQKLKKRKAEEIPKILAEKWLALIFLEPSTRTRISFLRAIGMLGGNATDVFPQTSSIQKGESLLDTLKTLEAEGYSYAVIRLSEEGVLSEIQPQVNLSIINAGEGKVQHPTQALGDWCTLKEHFPEKEEIRVCFVGDIISSRVFHSTAQLLTLMGASVRICAPLEFLPVPEVLPAYPKFSYVREGIEWADVIYVLRPQWERWEEKEREKILSIARAFQLHSLPEGKVVMHAGPFLRDVEIASSLVYSPQSLILEQVRNGYYARMALFFWLEGKIESLD